jgi:hypothetical protein
MSAARWLATVAVPFVLSACGDKVPESQAARRAGDVPKQIVDKAAADADKATRQGADRMDKAE